MSPFAAVAYVAIGAVVIGVFSTWTSDGPVSLNGIQGPNDGWLVLIVAALALAWTRSMARASRVGIVAVLGAAAVMGWTAVQDWLDGRDVFGADVGWGLLLVLVASLVLAGTAVARAVLAVRER